VARAIFAAHEPDLESAQAEAKRLQDEYVSTEHLFVALATEDGSIARRQRC